VVVGDARSLKLLGVPSYPVACDEASGATTANLTFDLLSSWHCDCTIVNMTFDTTASNTGHVSAACISTQQKLNKRLLWSGFRHHIGEVLLSHVFDDLQIETSRSLDVTVFFKFRKNFSMLLQTCILSQLSTYDHLITPQMPSTYLQRAKLKSLVLLIMTLSYEGTTTRNLSNYV
jgi:hypothetical protein